MLEKTYQKSEEWNWNSILKYKRKMIKQEKNNVIKIIKMFNLENLAQF